MENNIICPHCGDEDMDTRQLQMPPSDPITFECIVCQKAFRVSIAGDKYVTEKILEICHYCAHWEVDPEPGRSWKGFCTLPSDIKKTGFNNTCLQFKEKAE